MMNKSKLIDVTILVASPLLSFGIASIEIATGFMPLGSNTSRVMWYACAPVVWFSYIGVEALILWVIPTIFLALMVTAWCKSWRKRGHLFALLFAVCWIVIVHLFMIADAMGSC